ncbi:MAG: putative uridine kinase, partial [Marmoricola sp.]|nr:putative uridine kinase [Marmoricola sp.]
GLPLVPGVLARLLEPLAAGRPGSYREWDWIGGGPGDDRTVQPAPLLIVEGLGTGARRLRGWTTALVWIDADPEHRRVRALDRDGDYFRAQWAPWAASETAYFETEGLPGRADLHFWTG